jgi:hypothetical protein
MRTVFAVALCFLFGGCATFGGGEVDPYGIWDLVSSDGVTYPNENVPEWNIELRPDGSAVLSFKLTNGQEGRMVGSFSLGEEKDGCWPINLVFDEEAVDPGTGSICGREMTIEADNETADNATQVFHKRR